MPLMLYRYKAAFDLDPPLQVVRHPYQDKEQEKMRNRVPLSKLLTEKPATHTVSFSSFPHTFYEFLQNIQTTTNSDLLYIKKTKDVRFTCEGTITGFDTSRDWYYPSCVTCPNKIQVNEGVIECRIHGPLTAPTYR